MKRKQVQIKAKNPKMDKNLKQETACKIEKSIYLEKPIKSDFDHDGLVNYEDNLTNPYPHFFLKFDILFLARSPLCMQ